MKIIIVGAGVSGVSTYLLLRRLLRSRDSCEIHLYEAHKPRGALLSGGSKPRDLTDSAVAVGNIISLTPSSVRLLRYVDARLHDIFVTRGYLNEHYTYRSARGHTLAVVPASYEKHPVDHTITCPRYDSWCWLHEAVGEDNIRYRKVVGVDLAGERPVVKFADGGEEDADLVVGADGVRSVVKRALFGDEDDRQYAPCYE